MGASRPTGQSCGNEPHQGMPLSRRSASHHHHSSPGGPLHHPWLASSTRGRHPAFPPFDEEEMPRKLRQRTRLQTIRTIPPAPRNTPMGRSTSQGPPQAVPRPRPRRSRQHLRVAVEHPRSLYSPTSLFLQRSPFPPSYPYPRRALYICLAKRSLGIR